MPTVPIHNLPLDADGHQFWVAAVDHSGNTNNADMASTGYIQLLPLTAPDFDNTTIYTQRTDMENAFTEEDMLGVYPIWSPGDAVRVAPIMIGTINSTQEALSHVEIVMADDPGLEARYATRTMPFRWDYIDGVWQWNSGGAQFEAIDGKFYYFRARIVDQVGRVSPWSPAAYEQAGDRVGPPTVAGHHVDVTTRGHLFTCTINDTYTVADDHDYFEWWLSLTTSWPDQDGVRENDTQFLFGNKSGQTLTVFCAAVDTSGNRSTGYKVSGGVATAPFVSSEYWIETGNVTDISGDTVLNVTDRGIEDENGNTIFDFTSGTGVTNFNATLEGALTFGADGAIYLTDNSVSFGTPFVGMEIIARGLKLYQDANNYFILEKDGASSVNMEIVGGTFKTSGGTSRIEMDYDSIRGYSGGVQRFHLDSDGSGWLGNAVDFYWDTNGDVFIGDLGVTHIEAVTGSIAGWDIDSSQITVTPVATVTARLHSDGYIAFGSPAPTGYGNNVGAWLGEDSGVAKFSLYTDSNNFLQWDGSILSSTGINLEDAVITASVFQTSSSGARVVINSADGLRAFNSSPVQTVSIDTDGSGWFGLTGTRALEWNTSGVVTLGGAWTVDDETILTIFDSDKYLSLSTTTNNEAVYFYDPSPTSGDVRFVGMGTLHNGNSWTTETGMGVVVYNGATYDKYLWISDSSIEIAGWEFTEELFRSASSAERIELNATENRISIFDAVNEKVVMGYLDGLGRNNAFGTATGGSTTYLDDSTKDYATDALVGLDIAITSGTGSPQTRTITSNTATRIYASFSPAVGSGSVYAVRYTSSNYGFWALDGDTLMIDGDMTYESGDWIVNNDASLKIIDGSGNEILRLGTDSGEKGLFIYDTGAAQLAKYISDEIYIGEPGNFLRYTTAGGLVIEGDVTVAGSVTPRQPFDEDALLIWPLDAFPADQSSNVNHGDSIYGASVVQTTPGVGGAWASLFPNGTANGDYYRTSSAISAGARTITFWAKSSDTGSNQVFDFGASDGQFTFNASSSMPRLYLSASNYRYWVNPPEQDDNEWHFWCLEITGSGQEDIEDALLYVDLQEQTVNSTVSTGAITAWDDLRLGYSFSGSLQDFRIYNRALTDAERDGIYTNPMSRATTVISGDKITTGTLESSNWGASAGSQFSLNDGEFILGGSSAPDLEFTGGVLSLTGAITITGGSGIGSLTDAGDLAELDEIDSSYITDVAAYSGIPTLSELAYDSPSGAGLYLDATHMGYHSGGAWVTYFDNTGKLFLGSSEITVIPQTLSDLLDDTPVSQGMYMDSTHLGFHNGSTWDVYIGSSGSNGQFYLGGTSGDLRWDGIDLVLGGSAQLLFGATLVHGANIMAPDIRLWAEDSAPSSGYGYFTDGSNPYGGSDNNAIVKKINPWGAQDLIWECTSTTGDVLDGGWGYNTFNIDRDLRYRYSGWIKQCGDHNGGFYFGCMTCSNLTADGSDSNNTNPYFRSNSDLPNTSYFTSNGVTNGTMEIDNNWASYNSPTSNIRSSAQEHAGSYSRRIIVNGEGQGIYSDTFTVNGFVTYRLSVWLYGDGNEWSVYVDDGSERFYIKDFGERDITPISGEWTKHTVHFQPKERTTTARVYVVSAGDHSGTIYVDDVEVKNNGIINGDFEEVKSTQTSFTGWAHTGGTPIYCERSTTQAHSGSYSWRITVDAANEGVRTSKVQIANGTTTSTGTSKLIDGGASFTTDGTAIGDKVYNNTDNRCTTVTGIDSNSTLSIGNNYFTSGEAYIISSLDSYIKLVGGYQYRCVIWLYGNASNTWQAKVSDGTNDYNFLETNNTTTLVPPASWTQYTLDFEASANTDSAYIEITSVGTSGTLYIDDVTLQDTPWYLLTAFMHPDNYAGTESWGAIYHYKSGLKANHAITDFKSQASTVQNGFRLFYYNSSIIDPSNQQYQYSPAMHIVDGSEPTISAMIGNSSELWNIEGTTNISKYLVESPTIRGGDVSNGNYVQLDKFGIRGYGDDVNTFTLDAATGDVIVIDGTITGGTIQTSTSGQRIVLSGSANTQTFYNSSNQSTITLTGSAGGTSDSGIEVGENGRSISDGF